MPSGVNTTAASPLLKDLESALQELTRPDLSTANFAQIRRQICSALVANRALRRKVGLHAVPVDGTQAKGAELGFFLGHTRPLLG
jgi:hypothetical protein